MEEIWKDIPEYEWLYQASNLGRIKSLPKYKSKTERIMKQWSSAGYLNISFCRPWDMKTKLVHRLIAETFIQNTENKPCVNHKNWIKTDNNIINLERCTYAENEQHSYNALNKKPSMWMLWKQWYLCKNSKIIWQYTKDRYLIKIWPSAMFVERELGICHGNISACCLWKPKHATAGWYRRKYI